MDGTPRGTILIIDDEKTNILYLNRILSADYEILSAKDGAKGIELANEYRPDLILLDIVMPEMDGYETLSELKGGEATKAIPVIFITGLTGDENETKGLALGADDYISKPFNEEVVRLRVRNQIKILRQMRAIIDGELAEHKSRAKADFLSRMSHEMRTPMNAIMGMTALARMEADEEALQGHLRTIEGSSRDMLCLIDNMLDISDMSGDKATLSYSDFNVRAMVRGVLDENDGRKREKMQTLSVDVDPSVPDAVNGDARRLRQVLGNLVSNAVKFTGERGRIQIKVKAPESGGGEVTLRFEVIDDGIGIEAGQTERIFQLFERAEGGHGKDFEGIGSGLFITKHIVGMMGGSIEVESEPGKGSRFAATVRLREA
ncbi:MAG: response regulator [Oscillospiraceae bacterium]|nr:response regulator [Oscillospiraceae bacterium]